MGSFSKLAGGAGAVIITGGMLATATPSMAAGTRVVKVRCGAAALAAAITSANASTGAVLRLAAGCTYSVATPATAATALPVITGNLTLVGGPGTSIRRDPAAATRFRILDVAAGGTLRVAGLAILNGSTAGLGGGIQNAGTLVLAQTTVSGNTAGNGGGLANIADATATISRSLINANTTTGVGGGGILNSGTLTVFGSLVSANSAPVNGGGVNTQASGETRITETTITHNTSGSLGGGVSNLGSTSLDHSLVRANQASAGSGIASSNTKVTIRRSVLRNTPDNCSPANTIPGCAG